MKTVFIVGYVWPEPKSSAAGARMMQLLNFFLEQGYNVIFGTTAQKTAHSEDLERIGLEAIKIELNNSSFDELLQKIDPEIVVFDRYMMEEQFGWRVSEVCPNALQILDTEDLHFLRKARQEAVKKGMEITPALLQSETAKREIASIYRSDISLIISEYEMNLLQKYFGVPENLLFYLPFMPKTLPQEQIEKLPKFEERQHFISVGNFKHEPNVDAAIFLKKEIWPLIRRKLPEAEFHLFGAYPTPQILQLNNEKEGFLVKGRAESVAEVLMKARVLLASLRFGAGIKGKFTDAMRAGIPCITTSVGTEGMKKDNLWNGFIADKTEDFASVAVELYSNRSKWKEAQKNGFEILEKKFSEADHKARFLEKLQELSFHLDEHRLSNFTGALLKQHFLRSTKHLSRYIEIKNKLENLSSKNRKHP